MPSVKDRIVAVSGRPATKTAKYVVPQKHPWRWVGSVVCLILAAQVMHGLITNDAFGWPVVGTFLFDSRILRGAMMSILLTAICMTLAIVLGTVLAVMRLSKSPILAVLSYLYIWVFRSVPVLVQLVLWYNFGALYSHISLGIPFGPAFFSVETNAVVPRIVAATLGLGLAQAAYTAEVVRAGILSVPKGQTEAALSIGMTGNMVLRRVVLPQAMRVIIPPIGNEVIGMVKNTSLVSVIAMAELFYTAQIIYADNYQVIPLLMVACLWYLVIVSLMSVGQRALERHYGVGF